MLVTDWARPTGLVLARVSDTRVRHYWDDDHLIARRMGAEARPPQPTPQCCTQAGILWDIAAVYPPGAEWNDRLPTATFFNGPVVTIEGALKAALEAPSPSVQPSPQN